MLAERGVRVPASVVTYGDRGGAADLRVPLVVKAFGPGIGHKSEVGAVRLGLRAAKSLAPSLVLEAFLDGNLAPGSPKLLALLRSVVGK